MISQIDKKISKNRNFEKKERNGTICLGPVLNLEEYVKKDWWKRIFNSFYLKTDGDVVEDQKITKFEVDFFSEVMNFKPENYILDLCCGQGRHSIELGRRGFENIYGLDRSRYLIQKAKSSAKKDGIFCRFREGDARKLPYNSDFFDSVMIVGNSFGYFESINDDVQVLKEIYRVLKPWGKVLIDITDGSYLKNNFQPRSWEWLDQDLFVCRERSLSLDVQRLISREVITHVNKGVLVDQFYAERLYSNEQISELLKKVGFSDIKFHGTITPESQRDQDLGMMEKRIIVSALVKKEWSEIKKKAKATDRKVVVIFGDPNKPDVLKPSNLFIHLHI